MRNIKIISDSACDMQKEVALANDIYIVPFYVTTDGKNYLKEEVELTTNDFYKTLRTQTVFPKTSLPSVADYLEVFEKFAKEGNDIICFCLSAVFSGSYQSAVNAANILREQYSDCTIFVVDSKNATSGQEALVLEANRLKNEGVPIEKIAKAIEEVKDKTQIVFTLDSLDYLERGGRIGKAAAFTGGLLNIKPIILLKDGVLVSHSKVRGRKKAISSIIEIFNESFVYNKEDCVVFTLHSDCLDEATAFTETLKNDYGYNVAQPIGRVGVTVGAHVGPTVLGVGYMHKLKA